MRGVVCLLSLIPAIALAQTTLPQTTLAQTTPSPPVPIAVVPVGPAPSVLAKRGPNLPPSPRGEPTSWISNDDYPPSALRAEEAGTAAFVAEVNDIGRVENCIITGSSGSPKLDSETCRIIKRRARFFPATNAKGQEVAGRYTNRITWTLPDQPTREALLARGSGRTLISNDGFPRPPYVQDVAWNMVRAEDYPKAAAAALQEGASLLTLDVDASGAISRCTIRESSGYAALDSAACGLATQRLKLDPARDTLGKPTAGRMFTGVDWRLTQAPPPPPAPTTTVPPHLQPYDRSGASALEYRVTAEGKVKDCQYTPGPVSAFGNLVRVCEVMGRNPALRLQPFTDAVGTAVERIVKVRFSVSMEEEKPQ